MHVPLGLRAGASVAKNLRLSIVPLPSPSAPYEEAPSHTNGTHHRRSGYVPACHDL